MVLGHGVRTNIEHAEVLSNRLPSWIRDVPEPRMPHSVLALLLVPALYAKTGPDTAMVDQVQTDRYTDPVETTSLI
jgi:hypothetical protein